MTFEDYAKPNKFRRLFHGQFPENCPLANKKGILGYWVELPDSGLLSRCLSRFALKESPHSFARSKVSRLFPGMVFISKSHLKLPRLPP